MTSRNGGTEARRTVHPNRVAPRDRAGRQGGHVAGMQRRRLLSATIELAYEQGIHAITVATLCERAGLSRRTFYECFADVQDCVFATFSDSMERAAGVVAQTVAPTEEGEPEAGDKRRPRTWLEQTRAALTALLGFFDGEPGIARLLIVEALGAGHDTLEARRRGIAQIITFVDRGRSETKANREPPPLTAEGTVGAVFSVIHARILEANTHPSMDSQSLVELVGPLMATIVQPYLGTAAAQRELALPPPSPSLRVRRLPTDPFKDLPIRLTYRTVRVLSSVAEKPGASSKRIAAAAGITDPGQTSRLLTRLERSGLIGDTGIGPAKGQARAWTLTERGRDILQATGQD
jgi:AcrR family transcriptional regulator/DNA-binding MarR family transcriptional regulator